jgi:hypothetical protein
MKTVRRSHHGIDPSRWRTRPISNVKMISLGDDWYEVFFPTRELACPHETGSVEKVMVSPCSPFANALAERTPSGFPSSVAEPTIGLDVSTPTVDVDADADADADGDVDGDGDGDGDALRLQATAPTPTISTPTTTAHRATNRSSIVDRRSTPRTAAPRARLCTPRHFRSLRVPAPLRACP